MPPDSYARRPLLPGSGRRTRSETALRALLATVLSVLIALAGAVTLPPPSVPAAVQKAFTSVFNAEDNGAISIVGNAQMSCQTSTACTAARGRIGTGAALNNNNYQMAFQDVDDVAATTNSTRADVALPTGSTVLYARLIWSARLDAGGSGVAASGAPGVAKLRSPTQFAYSTVTATTLTTPNIGSHPYQASLDVTSTVAAGGNGSYFFADMVGATGTDVYAGWSLVIAYSNSNLPLRDLTVFEGFADISTTAGNSAVNATVSGFLTPATGAVNATVGVGAWEGDLGSVGDALSFNGTTLSDSTRPADNFFNSSISNLGVPIAARNPSYSNNLGVDFGRISANGVLGNGATSATVNVSTVGETIYLGLLTTEIDLYTPSFAGISKSVTNLNGNSPAEVGDTLEYRLSFQNSGDDTASAVLVRDTLPANITYVPGTIVVVSGAGQSVTPKTDASGDDVAEYVDATRLLRVRLGTGANQTSGGTVAPGGASVVTFHVTVDAAAAGTTVSNGGFLDYRAQTLNRNYTFNTNIVDTQVSGTADLSLTQVGSPTTVTAGSPVTYTLTTSNNGPNTASAVVTTDTLPAGVTFSTLALPTGTTCSVNGQVVTCTTSTLASGASIVIPITATVNPGTVAGTVVNIASVASNTTDDTMSNNTATATTTITRSADVALTKTGPSSVVAGSQPTYTLTVTNNGPSSATATSVTDTLPVGLTRVSVTPSQGTCNATGQTITCAVGSLAPAGTATIAIKVTVAASFTGGSVTNTASVTNTTTDATSGNNSASKISTVVQDADIAVTKTVTPATATAGNTVSYTLDVANLAGGSDARGVILSDTIPASLTLLAAIPTQGTCTSTSPVSCALGLITPGTSAQVTISARVKSTTSAGTVTNTAAATTTTAESVTGNNSSSVNLITNTRADLSLTKTADPDPVQLGNNLTYTLTAANNGPSQARGVTITDPLPAGTTFVSASSGCAAASETVTCTVGTVDPDSTAARTITVTTAQAAPAGTLTNTATVAASTTDPATANDSATFVSTTRASADLALTKTTSPSPVVAGRDVTYTVTAANNGPSTASGVRVLDTLPDGVSYRSSSKSSGGSCSRAGQDLSCAIGSVDAGASVVVTIVGRVDADLTATNTSNTATVDSTSPTDPTTSNNTATSTTAVSRSADLGVTLAATTPTLRAGETASFRIVVTNAGPSTSRGSVVTVPLPPELRPVAGSLPESCTITGQTISCEIGTLAVNNPTTLDFSAHLLANMPDGLVSATASVGATTADPSSDDNSASAQLSVGTAADLHAAITVSPEVLVAGNPATYTLVTVNSGPSDATGVTLTDILPDGMTYLGAAPSAGSCTQTGQRVSCTLDRIAAGGQLSVEIYVRLDPAATTSVTNVFAVTSTSIDPVADNNTASTTNEVGQSADLRLSKSVGPEPVYAGGTLHYALGAVNLGPSTAKAVVLDDTLPDGVQLVAEGIDAPPGVVCATDLPANRVTCTLGDLDLGASRSVTVDAFVPATADAGTMFTNSASLTSPTPTLNSDARTASVTSTVDTNADLSVTKIGTEESPTAGGGATYLVNVINHGPSVARAASFVDTLSESLSFDDAVNPLGDCGPNGSTPGGSRILCTLGDLAPGQNVQVQLATNVDSKATGELAQDTVTVRSDTPDSEGDDNSASLDQPISGQNDLELTKRLLTDEVVAGKPISYLLTVTNHGPSQASDVSLTDVLPDSLGFTTATASNGGECRYIPMASTPADDDQVNCRWGQLDVDESATATVALTVPANYPGDSIVNTATATSAATDPSTAAATVVAPVGGSADLSLSKTLLSGSPTAGQEMRWQLAIHNDGPSAARNVKVLDPTPEGVTFAAADSANADCSVTPESVACALGDVGAGDDVIITVTGTLAADFTGDEVTNAAAVSADTADPDGANDSASLTSPTGASADLSITKSVAPAVPTAGQDATWTITVANLGPSSARDLVLTDDLPDGVTLRSASFNGQGTCSQSNSLVCRIDVISAGSNRVLTVVGRLDPSYRRTSMANTAEVYSGVADPDPLNNEATATMEVGHSADLAVSQTGTASAQAGENVSWQVDIANAGLSDATGAVLVDDLPAGLLGATGTFPGGVCSVRGRTMTCPVGVVLAGDHVVVTVTGQVDPTTPVTSLPNTATVSADTTDPDTADLTSGFATAVDRSADLALTKTATTDTVTAGETVGWVLTVRNLGPSLARVVNVTDSVPDGVSNLTATTGAGTCTVDQGSVSCGMGDVAPGAPVQISVSGTLSASYADPTLVNQATVVSETTDPNSTNDEDTVETPVRASADLSLGKSLTSGRPVAGQQVRYVLTVHNAGPSDGHDIVVTDSLPAVIEEPSVTTPDGLCSVVNHDLTCRLTSLVNNGDAAIEVTGNVGPGYLGELSNTAAVSSTDLDPELLDNVGTADNSVTGSSNLAVTKSGPDTVVAGERATWTLGVSNAGPSTARNVTLVDHLPAGLTDVQVETTTGSCDPDGTCQLGDVGPGRPVVVAISGLVAADHAEPTLVNTAAVDSDTADPSSDDNTSRTSTEVTQSADLVVTKTSDPTQLRPGTDATYSVTVTNTGSSTARLVSVTDVLPEGLALRDGGPTSPQSCRVDGRTVSCETEELDPGSQLNVTIPVRVAAGYVEVSIVNVATARSATPDANPENNTAIVTSPVVGQADLTLRKTAPADVRAGEPLSWQLDLSNAGPSDAQQTVVIDTLPEGVGDVDAVTSQGSCSQTGRLLTCPAGVLAAGGSVHVNITTVGDLDPSYAPGDITNTADVTSPTVDPDADEGGPDGRAASATTRVTASADVKVTKVADQEPAVPGGSAGWTVTVVNTGPSTARGVELRDAGVRGLTGFTLTPPAGATCAAGVCTVGAVLPGAEHAVVFRATAEIPADDARESVTNTATVSTTTEDPDRGDNTASAPVPLLPSAGVLIVKTGPETATPGRDVSWSLTATNSGPSLARSVELRDTIPAAVTGITVDAPAGVTCSGGHELSCVVGDLAAGSGRAVTVVVSGTLAANFAGPELTNSATVSSSTIDPNAADNFSTTGATVTSRADLSLTKTGPATATAGRQISWTLTAHNAGPGQARNVVVTDALPAGIEQIATGSPEDGLSCSVAGSGVRCAIATLDSGADKVVPISGVVAANYSLPSLTNVARVSSDAIDPDPTNNTSPAAYTSVARSADVSITKVVTPKSIEAGRAATFTLTVSNAGPSTARGVIVTDPVPAGMAIGSVTSTSGTCAVAGQLVTCAPGQLAAAGGTPVVITIPVAVSADFSPGGFVNTASVTTTDPDPDLTNNAAQLSGDSAASADLAVTKVADRKAAVPGEPISWTLTVRNHGPATARGVQVLDILPDVAANYTATTQDGTCVLASLQVSCALGDLKDGESTEVEVTGHVPANGIATTITNSAAVFASGSSDPDQGDNVAQVLTVVARSVDLSLTKTTDTTTVIAGAPVQWTLKAKNLGPSNAYDVVLTDILPAAPAGELPEGCSVVERALRCAVGTVPAGDTVTRVLTATVDPSQIGPLSNTAVVGSAAEDLNLDDNTATTPPSPVSRVADVSVTKTSETGPIAVGDSVSYHVRVGSSGPSDATGVVIQETWPAGVQFRSAKTAAGAYDPATQRWTVGTLAPGQVEELVLVGTVTGHSGLRNEVGVLPAAGYSDPTGANNVAGVTISVREGPGGGHGGILGLPNTGGPGAWLLAMGLLGISCGVVLLTVRPRRRS